MQSILKKLDYIARLDKETKLRLWLGRLTFVFLLLMVLSAPHSIAATQISWLSGMTFWLARFFLKPRPKFIKTALFAPFFIYYGWAVLSSIFSYAPDISIDKLRGVSLFLIFFFTVNNLRQLRSVKFLAISLVFSCMFAATWAPIERLIGRGVEIVALEKGSPILKIGLHKGDILLSSNGKNLETTSDLENLVSTIEKNGKTIIRINRIDWFLELAMSKDQLLPGTTALEKLGIKKWKKSRYWRSTGFYSHYATFSEVLQLIASLTFGLFVASIWRKSLNSRSRDKSESFSSMNEAHLPKFTDWKDSPLFLRLLTSSIIFFCVAIMSVALLLTVTRASQGAFLVSMFSVILLNGSRKLFLIFLTITIPIVIAGAVLVKQSRNVGFFDLNDGSTLWRITVYREGFELWTKNMRNFMLGVGMDSIKRYKKEWRLFDNGKLPTGHFHSTPLQLLFERGLPALLFWLWILGIYLLKLFKTLRKKEFNDWLERGVLLGCFGASVGFFVSGLVHYNLGDGEVAMVFFLLMGFAMSIVRKK